MSDSRQDTSPNHEADRVKYNVSQQQIYDFLHTVLEIPADDIHNRHQNRFTFLNKLITAFHCHIPFQNLSFTSVPFEHRKQPTVQESIQDVFSRKGGICWTLNVGMYVMLKELGFEVTPILGSVAEESGSDHMLNIVHNIKEDGDMYLVDVGFCNPAHPLMSLDFDHVSAVSTASFSTARLVKRADGMYIFQEKIVPELGQRFPIADGDWQDAIYFKTSGNSLIDIHDSIGRKIYSIKSSLFNATRRITGTTEASGKYVGIVNQKIFIESEDKSLKKATLPDDEAVFHAINTHFPYVPIEIAHASYKEWHASYQKSSPSHGALAESL